MKRPVHALIVPLIVISVLLPVPARGEKATEDQMDRVCVNWLSYIRTLKGSWAGSDDPQVVRVEDVIVDGRVLARNYSIYPRGHIVVPVLMELPPVKLYSDRFGLDLSEPDGPARLLREVLRHRVSQFEKRYGSIEEVRPLEGLSPVSSIHREQWENLLEGKGGFDTRLLRSPAEPASDGFLLSTSWHQRSPYNNYCPWGDDSCTTCLSGESIPPVYPTLVGCVSTATSQIMNFWEWPPHGNMGGTYVWDGDNTCVRATPVETLDVYMLNPYDWSNMPDSCDSGCGILRQHAVAELCYEVGAGLGMDWGSCCSGTSAENIISELPFLFDYREGIVKLERKYYTAEEWSDSIRVEIEAGRPMVYVIDLLQFPSGFHAIVCDGWKESGGMDMYHMNYGWGGPYTGWWVIDEMVQSTDLDQEFLIKNIEPPEIYYVSPGGGGSFPYFPTIQDAVDAASDGMTIGLLDGTFTGTGNDDITISGKEVTIRSLSGSPHNCIIECQGYAHRAFYLDGTTVEGVVIDGITMRGANGMYGGLVNCTGSAPMFRYCVFDSSAADYGSAVYCMDADPVFNFCTFYDNEDCAVVCEDNSIPVFNSCTFYRNEANIYLSYYSEAYINRSIISYATGGEAVTSDGTGCGYIHCCDIFGNAGGPGCISGQIGSDGNFAENPQFCFKILLPLVMDLTINCMSPCAPGIPSWECGLVGAWQVGCYPMVAPDGTGTFPTIQHAVDGVRNGGVIRLYSGIYSGAGNREIDFHGKDVTLVAESGDPSDCVIDCGGAGPAFIFNSGESRGAVVEGLTIMNGLADYGGGVYCDGSSPTISNCVFEMNVATVSGGGLFCTGGASPAIRGCTFSGNTADDEGGAVYAGAGCQPVMTNCTLAGNMAMTCGGGISCVDGSMTIHNSIIAFNDPGAVCCGGTGDMTLNCCDVYGNGGNDWAGCILGQEASNGNISEDPLFCGYSGGDYRIDELSPCAPSDSMTGCDLVGAWNICSPGTGVNDPEEDIPPALRLEQNFPNPFNPVTSVTFGIPAGAGKAKVSLTIYDCLGRRIKTLFDGERSPGIYTVKWDGRNRRGKQVSSGIYFIQIRHAGDQITKKMVLLR